MKAFITDRCAPVWQNPYLIEFGELYFENTCYINFEANEKYRFFFEYDFNTDRILKEIVIHMIELVQNVEIPLSAHSDATYFKVYMSDVGLLCRRLGISYKNVL